MDNRQPLLNSESEVKIKTGQNFLHFHQGDFLVAHRANLSVKCHFLATNFGNFQLTQDTKDNLMRDEI